MVNKYPGKCANCGNTVHATYGIAEKRNGKWIVYHNPGECPEITSGLGIGGYGSDDYNIHNTGDTEIHNTGQKRRGGGGQLWEPCPKCGTEPVHLDCGYCERHCRC